MTASAFVSSLLSCLLQVLTFLLETFLLSSGPKMTNEGRGDEDTHHEPSNEEDRDKAVQTAFAYFEIKPQEATRELIKKRYKKLSLIHHPDRNDNSEESVKEMQKINHHREILEAELDRREGVSHHQDGNDEEESVPEAQEEEPVSKEERKRRKKAKQKKQRRARKKREEEHRRQEAEREAEMRREWAEMERKRKEFKRKQKNMKHKNRRSSARNGLGTPNGRDEAHQVWMEKVRQVQEVEEREQQQADQEESKVDMHDIDEHSERPNDGVSLPSLEEMPKPKNPIMDYCNDDVAVALRLGETEIAIDLIHENISNEIIQMALNKVKEDLRSLNSPLDFDDGLLRDTVFGVLSAPMDEDGNNALHYAVYLEDADMIDYLVHEARRIKRFAEFVTKTNDRGQVAGDFAVCCKKDPSIPNKMKALWDDVEKERESQKLGPRSKHLWNRVLSTYDLEMVLNTVASVFVGTQVFHTSWMVSLFFVCCIQGGPSGAKREYILPGLFAYHVTWSWLVKPVATIVLRFVRAYFSWRSAILGLVAGFLFGVPSTALAGALAVPLWLMCFLGDTFTEVIRRVRLPKKLGYWSKKLFNVLLLTFIVWAINAAVGTTLSIIGNVMAPQLAKLVPEADPVEAAVPRVDPSAELSPRQRAVAMFEDFEKGETSLCAEEDKEL